MKQVTKSKVMTVPATFRKAYFAGTPLIAITTPDVAHTRRTIMNLLPDDVLSVEWDAVRGFTTHDEESAAALKVVTSGKEVKQPGPMFEHIVKLPEKFVIFCHNAHLLWGNLLFLQSIQNLRDKLKADEKVFVMVGAAFQLPAELKNDVLLLDEGLPTDDELAEIILSTYKNAEVEEPSSYVLSQNVDGVRGLPAFLAEQSAAMTMTARGIDNEALWTLKKKSIETNKGIKFFYGGIDFDQIGGLHSVKRVIEGAFNGNHKRKVVVWFDEMEKALAGAGAGGAQESSGTTADALDVILDYMESSGATGIICVGAPGTGKTLTARAAAATYKVPLIKVDIGATKGRHVGDSEAGIRQAISTIDAIAQGGAFFIATCNRLENLPAELRRRFKLGTYYFDIPTQEERDSIWPIQLEAYGLPQDMERPDDRLFVGADIRNICEIAADFGWTLSEAAKIITPVVITDPDGVERLRNQADGAFLSASTQGIYRRDIDPVTTRNGTGRNINIRDMNN